MVSLKIIENTKLKKKNQEFLSCSGQEKSRDGALKKNESESFASVKRQSFLLKQIFRKFSSFFLTISFYLIIFSALWQRN